MNKKFLATIFSIVLIFFGTSYEASAKKEHKPSILIEHSYMNFAWKFIYKGIVICDDGSIYSFNMSDKKCIEKHDEGLYKASGCILENAKLESKKVSDEDLEKILEYISQIDSNKHSEPKHTAKDMGGSTIILYDYVNDSRIILRETGDWSSENTSPYAEALVRLIEEYTQP